MKHKSMILILLSLIIACNSSSPMPEANREVISTDKAPAAIGPYSQAIRIVNTLYLAGQIGMEPETGKLVEGEIEEQTHRAMKNLVAVLDAAGFSIDNVVQCQIFLSDLNNYKRMNDVYATYFTVSPPARAVVQAARIPRDALVEIMMVAVK